LNQVLPKEVIKYLRKFGFQNWNLELSVNKSFRIIVVVPAIQENINVRSLIFSLLENKTETFKEILFVFVVNNMKGTPLEAKDDNQKLISYLQNIISLKANDELALKIYEAKLNIALIDASSPGREMPEKDGGVGYARKIGMDIALRYFNYANNERNLLVCLDADCKVSNNYTQALINLLIEKHAAGFIEYEHLLPEKDLEKTAIIIYEIFLRYYVLGLKYAESPYAFDTIGSTMFCDVDSYIKIGGMNKKKAAEDFYFLEKLAKLVPIHKENSAKVYPSPRGSWRVPFGTGQRVNRFLAGTNDEFLLYNPICFELLKKWHKIFFSDNILSADEYLTHAGRIDSSLQNFLIEQSFVDSWHKILNETTKKEQLQKQKYYWFDGFRTLKLIHYIRDNKFPNVNMFNALDKIFEKYSVNISSNSSREDWQTQLKYLQLLRELNNR